MRLENELHNKNSERLSAVLLAVELTDYFQKSQVSWEKIEELFEKFRYGACEKDIGVFYLLYSYLQLVCEKQELNKIAPSEINAKLNTILEKLAKEYPAAPPIQPSEETEVHKSENFKQPPPPRIVFEEGQSPEQKKQKIIDFIVQPSMAKDHESKFLELVAQPCLKIGFGLLIGIKVKDRNDKRSLDRILEKLLKKELKDAKKAKELAGAKLEEFCQRDKELFDRMINQILAKKEYLDFTVSDMLRGKCLFNQVADINNCVSEIKARAKERNFDLIEVDNRLTNKKTNTTDIVLKIKIGETITEFQLALKFNYIQNMFSHKIYEIMRSFYESVNLLQIYNQTLSKNFVEETNKIFDYNNKMMTQEQQ